MLSFPFLFVDLFPLALSRGPPALSFGCSLPLGPFPVLMNNLLYSVFLLPFHSRFLFLHFVLQAPCFLFPFWARTPPPGSLYFVCGCRSRGGGGKDRQAEYRVCLVFFFPSYFFKGIILGAKHLLWSCAPSPRAWCPPPGCTRGLRGPVPPAERRPPRKSLGFSAEANTFCFCFKLEPCFCSDSWLWRDFK